MYTNTATVFDGSALILSAPPKTAVKTNSPSVLWTLVETNRKRPKTEVSRTHVFTTYTTCIKLFLPKMAVAPVCLPVVWRPRLSCTRRYSITSSRSDTVRVEKLNSVGFETCAWKHTVLKELSFYLSDTNVSVACVYKLPTRAGYSLQRRVRGKDVPLKDETRLRSALLPFQNDKFLTSRKNMDISKGLEWPGATIRIARSTFLRVSLTRGQKVLSEISLYQNDINRHNSSKS